MTTPSPTDPTVVSPRPQHDMPTVAASIREGPGTRIGLYKLHQLIGEGGFGSVFLAQQEQPVQRKVALKIIKLGMDTRQVVARFEQERQALAMMDHPGIAKVFDAGATETGRPYFVMELVKGEPIVEYCDKNSLSIRDRLMVFGQVCAAVQHAHTKGIIHRDIKPSNILVSLQDGKATAKVIDFGIAKATSAQLTEKTVFTEHRQLIGTPEYMSPEQAEGSMDIDTRTDVYSLGVLLYELLTGATPFDSTALRSAAYGEIQRIIREVDPPKPSTRLSTTSATLAAAASTRRIEPRRLGSMIRGELDWIVMKAMEKDRGRRYETASALEADIRRYLEGEAVLAAPPSAAYRIRKLVRRNKGLVTTTCAVAAALLVGMVGFAWQAKVARDERDRAIRSGRAEAEQRQIADAQRDRAVKAEALTAQRATELAQVAEFQSAQLGDLDPERMGIGLRAAVLAGAPESARAALSSDMDGVNFTNVALESLRANIFDRSLEAIGTRFADQPLVRARLLQSASETMQTLGLSEQALEPQREALEIRRRELGNEHPDTLESVQQMGVVTESLGRVDEAEPFYTEALETRRRVLGNENEATIGSIADSAYLLLTQGRYVECEALYRESLELATRVLGPEHRMTLVATNGVGYALVMQGKATQTEPYWRTAYEVGKRVLGEGHPDVVVWTNNMGGLLESLGRRPEAAPFYREAMEANRRLRGDEHPNTLTCMTNLSNLLRKMGQLDEAEALAREAYETRRRVQGGGHPDTLESMLSLASVLRTRGRLSEAEPLVRDVVDSRRRILGPDHPFTLDALGNLAQLALVMGKIDEAEAAYKDVVERLTRTRGPEHPDTLIELNNLGGMYVSLERYAEAEPILRSALEASRRVSGNQNPETLTLMSTYGRALLGLGRLDEAEPLFREGLEGYRNLMGPNHPDTYNAVGNMAMLCRARGQFDQAEPLYQEAVGGYERLMGKDHWRTAGIRSGLARTLKDLGRFAESEVQFLECERVNGTVQGVPAGRHRKSADELVALYEAWEVAEPGVGHQAKAEEWRARAAAIP